MSDMAEDRMRQPAHGTNPLTARGAAGGGRQEEGGAPPAGRPGRLVGFCPLRFWGRRGFGFGVSGGTSTPSSAAMCGRAGPRRSAVLRRSSVMVVGAVV